MQPKSRSECQATRYYAHTAEDAEGNRLPESSGKWQPLADHLRNVADLAAQFAAPFGASDEARLAGLLHDLGKYSERFQARLSDPRIHGINHWAAGAVHAFLIKRQLIAFPIDGHHTGLPPTRGADGLEQTLRKFLDPKERPNLTGCPEDLPVLLSRLAADDIVLPTLPPRQETDHFAAALRARFLLSALTDADFLDTENHFDISRAARRRVCPLQESLALEKVLSHLATKASDTDLCRLRRELLDACLAKAELPPGLFTLTAPTGSGKTLASLAFALRHIVHHNRALAPDDPRRLRRLIVVIPYTSIIEQTARVFRELFAADFGEDYVLEHHANVAPSHEPGAQDHDSEEARIRRARLAAENWSAPIVVTTNVRFFESLFAHKTSACRRLHSIARSVVLFDEVQTLPPALAPSLLSATRLLTRDYGCSTVFMTATQPAFATVPLASGLTWEPVEINPRPDVFATALRRTEIVLEPRTSPLDWPALAVRLASHDQALCVVNTIAHARDLFRLLPAEDRFHLSARLCPAHRFAVLAEIRQRLDRARPRPCRLVSTQLIEAGVDVDFPVVFRAFGPLNREGRQNGPGRVTVFHSADPAMPPGVYRLAAAKTEDFLARHPAVSLDQPATYARYFEEFYRLAGPEVADRDAVLAHSQTYDFPAASEKCRLIDSDTRAVIVDWGEGAALIAKLQRERHLTADECRRAQCFSVNLYPHEFSKAQAGGAVVQPVPDFDLWVWKGHYDPELGAVSATADDCIL
ncbi:MAG: CRISPR-associated endonuclease Cas3'' [Opitutae bacterium]|nr:CRISPR-associated endonuclease Cas3'' [Opitutae bacterium]